MNELSQYLERAGLSQAEFAGRVGITQGTVSKLCKGRVGVSLSTAFRIERETGGAVPASTWFREGTAA